MTFARQAAAIAATAPLAGAVLAALAFAAPVAAREAPQEAPRAAREGSPPRFDLLLAPGDRDGDGTIETLGVTATVADAPATFRLPLVLNTVVTSAADIAQLSFTDARGPLAATVEDERPDPANAIRRWHAERPPEGPLTIRYALAIDPDRPFMALPQYELRTGPAGFSGAGTAFVVLPEDDVRRDVRVAWDLSALPAGALGISSLGVGDARSERALSAGDLASTYYMAGRPELFRSDGFFAAWQGALGFPGHELMQWAADLHAFYGRFFRHRPATFGVFGRTNAVNPGSGIGLTDSFAFTFDEHTPADELKGLLAHEMLHAWVRSLSDGGDGAGGLASSWFSEGLAVHYQRMLPWRAGLIDDEAFLADLNATAGRYYTNALIATPNEQVPAGFWRDTRIRVLPYDRGSLYFAALDEDIRAASGGARSLDDLVRAMLAERRAGRPMDRALFERLLHAELGDDGLAGLEAMLAGDTVLPSPDAFGPCFTRVTRPLRRFDLGFDPAVLVAEERVVTGLKPGSQAARAGLRNGDRIVNRFPQDSLQGDQEATLTLQVERDGRRFEITYLPRGETVEAYQWQPRDCARR